MRGFLAGSLNGNGEVALEFYNSALEILRWGAERWKDVPDEEKGAIFEPWFACGIKGLRIGAYLAVSLVVPSLKSMPR
jgi:hypothetical protein